MKPNPTTIHPPSFFIHITINKQSLELLLYKIKSSGFAAFYFIIYFYFEIPAVAVHISPS
ncbi:hypothetical protein [Bacillus sp. S66]|uniref:hypothetical protein n=1 Tax=Bacillus sp. S66 TaxID=1842608 RepID=UPI001604C1EE|nr:hypothetical protein [Bacillus sp. S66]